MTPSGHVAARLRPARARQAGRQRQSSSGRSAVGSAVGTYMGGQGIARRLQALQHLLGIAQLGVATTTPLRNQASSCTSDSP